MPSYANALHCHQFVDIYQDQCHQKRKIWQEMEKSSSAGMSREGASSGKRRGRKLQRDPQRDPRAFITLHRLIFLSGQKKKGSFALFERHVIAELRNSCDARHLLIQLKIRDNFSFDSTLLFSFCLVIELRNAGIKVDRLAQGGTCTLDREYTRTCRNPCFCEECCSRLGNVPECLFSRGEGAKVTRSRHISAVKESLDPRSNDPLRRGVSVPNGATGGDLIVGMGCPVRACASAEYYPEHATEWQHEVDGTEYSPYCRLDSEHCGEVRGTRARHLSASRDQVTSPIRWAAHLVTFQVPRHPVTSPDPP
jgi:hypothetical protein